MNEKKHNSLAKWSGNRPFLFTVLYGMHQNTNAPAKALLGRIKALLSRLAVTLGRLAVNRTYVGNKWAWGCKAQVIAKVQVLDELSEGNSQITYDGYDTAQQTIVEYYSLRKVEVTSANNGLVNLNGIKSTAYDEIKAKSIIEFESKLPQAEIEKILSSTVLTPDSGNDI